MGIGGIAVGIGKARAAKQLFTDADAAELRSLEKRRSTNNLGMSERDRAGFKQASEAQIGTITQGNQLDALQRQASGQALGAATSARDVFLADMAGQRGAQEARTVAGKQIADVDQQRRQEHLARIKQLQDMRTARKVGRIQGISEAVGAGLDSAEQAAYAVAGARSANPAPPSVSNAQLLDALKVSNSGSANSTTQRTAYTTRF